MFYIHYAFDTYYEKNKTYYIYYGYYTIYLIIGWLGSIGSRVVYELEAA